MYSDPEIQAAVITTAVGLLMTWIVRRTFFTPPPSGLGGSPVADGPRYPRYPSLAAAACLAFALIPSALTAADPGPIRLPGVPAAKVAPVSPDAVPVLSPDTLYVIDADVPVLVLASPAGLVTLTEEVGPVKVRGKFADGAGVTETRTYKGKQVVFVEAAKAGRVELLIVPQGATKAADVIRRTIDVMAARPPPDDGDKKDDKKDPPPGPKAAKLYLAIVRDPMAVSVDAATLIGDTPFWDGLKRDGHEWDVWSHDSPRAKELNYLKLVEGVALPALLVLDKDTGRKLSAGPLPKDKAAVVELVKGVVK